MYFQATLNGDIEQKNNINLKFVITADGEKEKKKVCSQRIQKHRPTCDKTTDTNPPEKKTQQMASNSSSHLSSSMRIWFVINNSYFIGRLLLHVRANVGSPACISNISRVAVEN